MAQIPKTYKCRLPRLTKQFRQQYSKIGNTREQLFHMWQSFHFSENTETLDSYMMYIKTCSYTFRLWRTTNP